MKRTPDRVHDKPGYNQFQISDKNVKVTALITDGLNN